VSTPTPPLGYSLENVPVFLQPTAQHMRIQVEPPNGIDVARVSPAAPNTVVVNQPSQFTQGDLDHETVHSYDLSRNPAVIAQEAKVQAQQQADGMYTPIPGQLPKAYDYGGADGLIAAQLKHQTIADFGPEQRAQMVKDYAEGTQAAMRTGNTAALDKLNQAYGPYLGQEASMPGKSDSMTTMTQQDLTPAAPGLPPSSETGIMAPNPLLGGPMRIVPPVGYTLE
jgi:hypothetical protein